MERRSFLRRASTLLGMLLMPFAGPRRPVLRAQGQNWHWIRPGTWKGPDGRQAARKAYRHIVIMERVQVLDWGAVLKLVGAANSDPFLNVAAGGLIFDSIRLRPLWSGREGGRWWQAEVSLVEPVGGCPPDLPQADLGRLLQVGDNGEQGDV